MAVTIKNPVTIVKQGGGGGGEIKEKDINFYDYDGTLLYSYTVAEAQALTELPALPNHSDLLTVNGAGEVAATLVGDGWTHTLQEIKSTRLAYVGACYKINTSAAQNPDKCCAMIIDILVDRQYINLRFSGYSIGDVIHWGDGTQERISSSPMSHTYQTAGRYLVFIFAEGTAGLRLGEVPSSGNKYSFLGNSTGTGTSLSTGAAAYFSVELLVIGGVYLTAAALSFTRNISNIIITRYCRGMDKASIYWCGSPRFKSLTIPPEVPITAGETRFTTTYGVYDTALEMLIAPMPSAPPTVLANGQAISRVEPPKYLSTTVPLTSIGQNISRLKIPSGWFTDDDSASYQNWTHAYGSPSTDPTPQLWTIEELVFDDRANFPLNLCRPYTNVGGSENAYIRYGLPNLRVLDFRAQTTVLTLAATSDFTDRIQPKVKVVVPDNLYASWVADAQWSSVASQIVKDSDYNE